MTNPVAVAPDGLGILGRSSWTVEIDPVVRETLLVLIARELEDRRLYQGYADRLNHFYFQLAGQNCPLWGPRMFSLDPDPDTEHPLYLLSPRRLFGRRLPGRRWVSWPELLRIYCYEPAKAGFGGSMRDVTGRCRPATLEELDRVRALIRKR